MQHYNDTILYKTHQHKFVLILKILSILIPFLGIILLLHFTFWQGNIFFKILLSLIVGGGIVAWNYFFWSKSYFMISNEKIIIKVRNGIFSKYHMSIHFRNIRDIAFSKNNIFHYLLGYGTIFARSSAGSQDNMLAPYIPDVEKVYKILDTLHNMDESERKKTRILNDFSSVKNEISSEILHEAETLQQAIEKEKKILLSIQGLKEVVLLDGTDRRYIFEHEEERNHGVFECLRRQVLFAATHDSTLRDPDESIVMQAGEKVIFPVVEFHEIKRKKVSSSSPGIKVHEYLVPKFQDFDAYDATLLIGFDI